MAGTPRHDGASAVLRAVRGPNAGPLCGRRRAREHERRGPIRVDRRRGPAPRAARGDQPPPARPIAAPGPSGFVVIEGDPMLWCMQVARVVEPTPRGPLVTVFTSAWPTLLLTLRDAAEGHHVVGALHHFVVRVASDWATSCARSPSTLTRACARSCRPTGRPDRASAPVPHLGPA